MQKAGAVMGWDADGTAHTRTSTMSFGKHPVTGEWAFHFSGDCWNGLLYQLYLGMYGCRYSLIGRWFYHLMYAFRFKFHWPRHDPYPSRTFFADGTTLSGDETRHIFKLFEKVSSLRPPTCRCMHASCPTRRLRARACPCGRY